MKSDFTDINFILENVHDHVVITDTMGIIQYVNNSFLMSSGYDFEELVGKNMNILKSGHHSVKFYKHFWDTISSGSKFSGTFKNRRKNGDFFWVKKSVTPLYKNNVHIGYLSISSDITGYKAFENKLKEEHDFTNVIINTSQALILVLDNNGLLVSINDACVNLSGFKKEELIGKKVKYLINTSNSTNADDLFEKIINQQKSNHSFILPLKTIQGNIHLIKWSNNIIKNSGNSIKYIVCNGIDITEEHNYKEELQSLNENLQSLVFQRTKELENLNIELIFSQNRLKEAQQIANVGNWDWDIITNDLFWSDEIYIIFELEVQSLTPTYPKFLERVHPDDINLVTDGVDLALKKIKIYDVEHRVITPNNTIKHVRERGKVYFNMEGEPYRMIGTVQDITKQKEFDLKLIKNEARLAEAQRIAKMGSWSWEINTNEIYWSDEVYNIFEVNPNQFILNYANYISKIHPDDVKSVEYAIAKLLSEKSNYDITHRIVVQNGNYKYIRCKSKFETSADGNIDKVIGTIQDINKQKTLQNKMEQAYQVIENSLNANFIADLEGNVTYVNNTAAKLWGFNYTAEMVEAWPHVTNYWHIDSVPKANEILRSLPEKGTIFLFNELKGVKKDGSIFYPIFNASAIKDEHNKTIGFTASFFDMTEKVKIERELTKYDERLQFIFTNTEEIIFAIDTSNEIDEQRIIFISDSIEKVLGYPKSTFINDLNILKTLVHPEDIERCEAILNKIVITQKAGSCIFRIKSSNNNYIWIENRITPSVNNNKIISLYGYARDVTERIKNEQTIIESERKYRALYENATVGIFKTNIITQKAVEANDVCIDLFGYSSKEEFLANFRASNHYFHEAQRDFIVTEMSKRGKMSDVEMKFIKCNGEIFWGKISGRHIEGTNEIEGVVIDITKRVLFEEELKKALHEKELLLKEVHHRVKNNLQIVSGLLLLQINKISDPKILAPLLESRDRIETISLVHEKLYKSNNLSHISFKEYLEELSTILLQTYSERKIDIILNIKNILLNIETAIPMGLIFHELISNSLKHGFTTFNPSAKIEIEISNLNENIFQIKYCDNGQGCNENILANSFSLGMKLVNALVKELSGNLQVSSTPNNGVNISFNASKK